MRMKIFVTVSLLLHSLLGNLCMMPMAYAAPIPMEHHEEIGMNMTPMFAMSPAHCEHCVKVTQKINVPMDGSCTGYCLAKAQENARAMVPASSAQKMLSSLPSLFPTFFEPTKRLNTTVASRNPSENLFPARGVVMLL